ncbi:hypothetical protein PTE30175_04265 [Pandoraea terrae]|uniref:Uncharacterized protein n=1 Tax=Pandoraea terrae TaxID=1537710 RepID=A0A5E4Y8Y9_9BURK|nr:hypothetical protein [Pandoraea terrae]VVE45124.1 hypothetical protein PTE30175_04265 [Pandoraea terrae]
MTNVAVMARLCETAQQGLSGRPIFEDTGSGSATPKRHGDPKIDLANLGSLQALMAELQHMFSKIFERLRDIQMMQGVEAKRARYEQFARMLKSLLDEANKRFDGAKTQAWLQVAGGVVQCGAGVGGATTLIRFGGTDAGGLWQAGVRLSSESASGVSGAMNGGGTFASAEGELAAARAGQGAQFERDASEGFTDLGRKSNDQATSLDQLAVDIVRTITDMMKQLSQIVYGQR